MLILDTNVVSALMRLELNPVIGEWLDKLDRALLATTAVTIFEVRQGIDGMPGGKRKHHLETEFIALMDGPFRDASHVIPLDRVAAEEAGRVHARRLSRGVNTEITDTMIGAIAVTRGLPLVTRNVRHFDDLPVTLINPWAKP